MKIVSTLVFILIFVEKTIEFLLFRRLLTEFRNLAAERKRRELMAELPQHNVIVMDVSNVDKKSSQKTKTEDSDDDVSLF